jgi:hypothetical protein
MRHRDRPFDRVHADVGAAVDRKHAVAVMTPARRQKPDGQLDLRRIERA